MRVQPDRGAFADWRNVGINNLSDRETRPVSWLFFTESRSKRFRACGGPVIKIKRLTPDWWATVRAFEARVDVEVDDSNAVE